MVWNIFQRRQNMAPSFAFARTTQVVKGVSPRFVKPAIALVFLMAIAASMLAIRAKTALHNESTTQDLQTIVESEGNKTSLPEGGMVQQTDQSGKQVGSDSSDKSTTNSVKIESSIVNGQASTNVEVNGQKVEVPYNGSTSTVIQNGSGSSTNVMILNSQSGADGTFNTNNSFSSSNTYSSTYVGGANY